MAALLRLLTVTFLFAAPACAHAPTLKPDGKSGPYVHADAASGPVQAGFALPPKEFTQAASSPGWPPQLEPASGACPKDRERVESALGVAAIACPSVEVVPLAGAPTQPEGVADGDQPITNGGVIPKCYALGNAVLVVEYVQPSSACTQMVGLAVFHNGGSAR